MTETEHTPGPWYEMDVEQGATRRVADTDKATICTLGDTSNPRERDANARLIATSPTMYDYIKKQALNGDEGARKIIETLD